MRRALGLLAATVIALGGAACGEKDNTIVGPAPTVKNQNTAELTFFVPTALPEGVIVTRAVLNRGEEPGSEAWGGAIGIPAGERHTAAIHAFVSTLTPEQQAQEEDSTGFERVRVGDVDAEFKRDEISGSIVRWRAGVNAVAVVGSYDSHDAVLAAARGLRVAPKGKVRDSRFDRLPPRYREIGSGGSDATGARNDYAMRSEPGSAVTVSIQVRTLPEGFDQPTVAFGWDVRERKIRGKNASLGTSTSKTDAGTITRTHLVWRERKDLVVSIQGELSEAEVVAIAEGLDERTEQEWRSELQVEDR